MSEILATCRRLAMQGQPRMAPGKISYVMASCLLLRQVYRVGLRHRASIPRFAMSIIQIWTAIIFLSLFNPRAAPAAELQAWHILCANLQQYLLFGSNSYGKMLGSYTATFSAAGLPKTALHDALLSVLVQLSTSARRCALLLVQ